MRRLSPSLVLSLLSLALPLAAQEAYEEPPPLLPPPVIAALSGEVSGTAAKRTVQDLTLFHRQRGSQGFHAASQWILERAREAGLDGVEVISLPADGTIFYGTQRSRPAWDAQRAELWEQEPGKEKGSWVDTVRIASWEARPVTLAQDSAGGEGAADLVDVGAGTDERDYAGKDVRGKLVLVSAQPGAAYPLAVDKHGAAGLVSYAQNQRTAWWKEDETLVRWGHLDTFPAPKTFAFMVSLKQARAWQERLQKGETVHLKASVEAGQHPGSYEIATALLRGRDPALAGEEVVFSCHLDHQRPGANDNASGCAAILEAGRTLAKLVRSGKLPAPRRTLRFVFPPEIEGTISLLNARPEIAARAKAVIHMDMVGGEPEITRAVFHVTRSPKSLPTFVNDVSEAFGRFVNVESYAYAATGTAVFPLVDPEGGKRALQAEFVDYTEGSDHQVWTEGSFRVPAIYLNDWPDRYIHTSGDVVGNLDSTKLLRAAFLGAASAYYLADLDASGVPALWQVIRRQALARTATALERRDRLRATGQAEEGENLLRFHFASERAAVESISRFAPLSPAVREEAIGFLSRLEALSRGDAPQAAKGADSPETSRVYRRAPAPKGPMAGFGYDYLRDKTGRLGIPVPALLNQSGLWGGGSEYAYEALNLVDGRRTVRQIRDDLSAIYGPVPLPEVAEYLQVLERIGVLQ